MQRLFTEGLRSRDVILSEQTFERHFQIADGYIGHVDTLMSGLEDDFLRSRYLGFVIVSTVTVYEISAKEIIFKFARKKNKVFGEFLENRFERFNARIQIADLNKDFVVRFGKKYSDRFKRKLDDREKVTLNGQGLSMKGAYKNLINWRNNFVHTGDAPTTTNYDEVKRFYFVGQDVLRCLDETLVR